jgi:hypothetical protein
MMVICFKNRMGPLPWERCPHLAKDACYFNNFTLVGLSQVRMRSINRITRFFSSKEAVSRDVALQTAAALQVRSSPLDI